MTLPKAPKWLFWTAIALLFAYEGWALLAHNGQTISEMFWRGEMNPHFGPLLGFTLGMLMGHLFWQK